MMDVVAEQCLQRNEFWVGVCVHLGILLVVFGSIFVWNVLRKER